MASVPLDGEETIPARFCTCLPRHEVRNQALENLEGDR
jgi:hypothetical protein